MGQINLDPPEDYLDAKNLNMLIERWLSSLNVADVTQVAYRHKIVHFTCWWEQVGPAREWRLTQSALQDFETHLRNNIIKRFDRPLAYTTRRSIMVTLRTMFRWATRTGRTTKNYGEWVPAPAGSAPHRKSATPEQLARLMLAAGESRQAVRDQALLAFFIGTGCRLGEVAALNVEDLQILADGAGTAQVIGKHTPANKSGQHAIAFDAVTGRYLVRYMDEFVVATGALWLNDEGGKIEAAGIYQMVKRTIARAGLEKNIRGCHDLRRAFATILSMLHPDNPMWADMIRRQLGHKHYSMTAHYTLIEVDDIRDRIVTPLALNP